MVPGTVTPNVRRSLAKLPTLADVKQEKKRRASAAELRAIVDAPAEPKPKKRAKHFTDTW
jgi:hypothetical protein